MCEGKVAPRQRHSAGARTGGVALRRLFLVHLSENVRAVNRIIHAIGPSSGNFSHPAPLSFTRQLIAARFIEIAQRS